MWQFEDKRLKVQYSLSSISNSLMLSITKNVFTDVHLQKPCRQVGNVELIFLSKHLH